jgi:hypothetical protein
MGSRTGMLRAENKRNMSRKFILAFLAVASLLSFALPIASAISTSYRISFDANVSSLGGVSSALVNPPQTSQGTRDLAFTLDDNQSFTWNVFALYVSGYPLLTADGVPVSGDGIS